MDPREAMTSPGTASYYMPRGMTGSVASVQGTTSMHPLLTGAGVPFQSSSGNSSVGQTLVVDPSSTALPQSEPPLRRKRGRPRKYGVDSSKVSLALTPPSAPAARLTPSQKRGRGRPPGTGRKQQLASLGGWMSHSAGSGFTPHIITVAVGEDITTKIMSFLQQGPKAVCILSANGAVTTVTLRQPSTSGGTVTYEGQFEILSLSGSYLLSNNSSGPQGLRTGSLSICLASPDGRVIGGGVGGVLIAASPVQVILGSFICVGSKAAKSKPPVSIEGAAAHLNRQSFDNSVTPSDMQQNQNLNWPLQ
ncbi:PREDICTED: AT-hook motif nuclear-localized protein 9-like isoform X2 [Ipomoea nil]|uniref:AT-hook motif nuclear-localized protein 9-like isoform X2 n=1 Tax=Ipomoea nil TaxID=35883 RepID=UPI0009016988|nr:PREDICTED: AT-hook motif nuclear-localized protein 9-like isoform X2 [Ipomoea nil]